MIVEELISKVIVIGEESKDFNCYGFSCGIVENLHLYCGESQFLTEIKIVKENF